MSRGFPRTAELYDCRITHTRRAPRPYAFAHRTHMWCVDVDEPPAPPWWLRPLCGFRAADHLGDPSATIRANLTAYLARNGVDLAGGPVRMLAHARVLGHVFNPLTVYWCRPGGGPETVVVAEVRNTYGERHCYLLRPGPDDRATTRKDFYVSPFFPVDGVYRMTLPEPDARLRVAVTLDRPRAPAVFTAVLSGRRVPGGAAGLLRATLRRPWSTALVSAAIRLRGLRLWRRGLPVAARPPHRPQPGVGHPGGGTLRRKGRR
ncbi:MAG TPA: DUF1365 domain-containing protein [Streptosporangiaceae bacterium]